jgi:thiamine pyrophosphate-dependent acetolactate synthase large subunit-like protein
MATTVRSYENITQILSEAELDTVFTVLSGSINSFVAHVANQKEGEFRVVHTRHEQGAVGMADGYARSTGDIGVCIVGKGPAIAQAGSALVAARKRGSNLLVILPEPPLSRLEDDFPSKRFGQEAYLQNLIGGEDADSNRYGYSDTVYNIRSTDTLVEDFRNAIRRLRAGEGPIAVQVPADILNGQMDSITDTKSVRSEYEQPTGQLHPSDAKIEAAVESFVESDSKKPPVILGGLGAVESGARDEIVELAEKTGGYLATTLQAKGFFSDHPFSLGFIGGLGSNLANQITRDADYVVALGCSLNPFTTNGGELLGSQNDGTLIQVDTDPTNIGRYTTVDCGIHGDAKLTAQSLVAELDGRQIERSEQFWTEEMREQISEQPTWSNEEFDHSADRLDPRLVVQVINENLPRDRCVLTDAGHHTSWIVDGIDVFDVGDLMWPLDFSGVGQSIPIGIGAAVGRDLEACVLFCGDGGLMMGLQQIETAARHQIPILFVVLNDDALGAEYHPLNMGGEYAETATLENPEFAAIADDFGATGYSVETTDDLEAFSDRLSDPIEGTIVADCKINRDVLHPRYR